MALQYDVMAWKTVITTIGCCHRQTYAPQKINSKINYVGVAISGALESRWPAIENKTKYGIDVHKYEQQ